MSDLIRGAARPSGGAGEEELGAIVRRLGRKQGEEQRDGRVRQQRSEGIWAPDYSLTFSIWIKKQHLKFRTSKRCSLPLFAEASVLRRNDEAASQPLLDDALLPPAGYMLLLRWSVSTLGLIQCFSTFLFQLQHIFFTLTKFHDTIQEYLKMTHFSLIVASQYLNLLKLIIQFNSLSWACSQRRNSGSCYF